MINDPLPPVENQPEIVFIPDEGVSVQTINDNQQNIIE
jgi:hypothetical protein